MVCEIGSPLIGTGRNRLATISRVFSRFNWTVVVGNAGFLGLGWCACPHSPPEWPCSTRVGGLAVQQSSHSFASAKCIPEPLDRIKLLTQLSASANAVQHSRISASATSFAALPAATIGVCVPAASWVAVGEGVRACAVSCSIRSQYMTVSPVSWFQFEAEAVLRFLRPSSSS